MVAGVNHGAAADCTEDMLKTNTSALAPVLAALALTAARLRSRSLRRSYR